jgi:molybdopterin-guanine dinucleotide biosynthesis protein A
MGSDKAFLQYEGRPFVSAVASEVSKVSDDVLVLIGTKMKGDFESVLDKEVRVLNDDDYIENPLGGMWSAFVHAKHTAAAIVSCDTPLLKADVILYLFSVLGDHSAAVPLHENGDRMSTEPLCAVYKVAEGKKAVMQTLEEGLATPKNMVLRMKDVLYINVSELASVDPLLGSFVSINTRDDYSALKRRRNPVAFGLQRPPEDGAARND